LLPVIKDINDFCIKHKVDLAACHIPGVENSKADRMSRWERHREDGDWRVRDEVFNQVHSHVSGKYMMGQRFTLDGSADPAGTNAMLPRFRSCVDSVLDADLCGERMWCNPDFRIASGVLEHFIQAYRSAPESTSGTFLLPEWTDYPFWKLVKGAHLVARYPKGTPLFTSPDWDKLRLPGGGHSLGSERCFRGNTRWPVVVIHFPCSGARRTCESRLSASSGYGQDRGGCSDVHVLRGDPHRDGPLLRGMPPGIVR
jgi:hypothetical protein